MKKPKEKMLQWSGNKMWIIVITVFLAGITGEAAAQTDSLAEDTIVYDVVEKMPAPADETLFYKNLQSKFTYNCFQHADAISTKLWIFFIVDKSGELKEIRVEYNKEYNECLTKEISAVLAETAPWIPGEQKGKKVNVRMRMPVIIERR